MIFGLWHNGWCEFRTTRNPDRLGYGYSGTEEEARAGQSRFVKEGRLASEYEVVPFDHLREPLVKGGKPTPRQLEALKRVDLTGHAHPAPIIAVYNHGWVCSNITADGQEVPRKPMRLTTAGKGFLGREVSSPSR